jgi:hypothetical protein
MRRLLQHDRAVAKLAMGMAAVATVATMAATATAAMVEETVVETMEAAVRGTDLVAFVS